MKRKLILSIFAALLAVAMLLPLTSCEPKGSEGAETTATPTVEETTPPPTEESRGALIPHTEAMLDLKAEWEKSDAVWAQKLDASLFEDVYENDRVREGEQYLVKIYWQEDSDYELVYFRLGDRISEIAVYFSGGQKLLVAYVTPSDILKLARPFTDKKVRVTSAKGFLSLMDQMAEAGRASKEPQGALMTHSAEMLTLQAEWENSEKAWAQKLDASLFGNYYEGDRAFDGALYLVKVYWNDDADLENLMFRYRALFEEPRARCYIFNDQKMFVCELFPEQMKIMAEPIVDYGGIISPPEKEEADIRILPAKGFLECLENIGIE